MKIHELEMDAIYFFPYKIYPKEHNPVDFMYIGKDGSIMIGDSEHYHILENDGETFTTLRKKYYPYEEN